MSKSHEFLINTILPIIFTACAWIITIIFCPLPHPCFRNRNAGLANGANDIVELQQLNSNQQNVQEKVERDII